MPEVKEIDPKTAHTQLKSNEKITLIDVRTEEEFQEAAAEGALNYPLGSWEPQTLAKALHLEATSSIFFICRSGNRSHHAAQQFLNAGYVDVYNIVGGTLKWQALDLPLQE